MARWLLCDERVGQDFVILKLRNAFSAAQNWRSGYFPVLLDIEKTTRLNWAQVEPLPIERL
jgi:hypothetical protein